jgi:hypothetical protein
MKTTLFVDDEHTLVHRLRLEGDYVWRLVRPDEDIGWSLRRQLPTGGEQCLVIPLAIGRMLYRRWGRTRKGRPVGQRPAATIIARLLAPPEQQAPVDQYVEGVRVRVNGTSYVIVQVVKGKRGRGYARVVATWDEKSIVSDPNARCECSVGRRVSAVDLVTEEEFHVCAECRRRVA